MIVYSQKLAGYLMMNGFVLQGIQENKINNGKNVFIFNDSEQINKYITDYRLTNRK